MDWVSKDWFWLPHDEEVAIPVQMSKESDGLVATSASGESFRVSEDKVKDMKRVHPSAMRAISNMIHLEDMSENVILHTLRERYKKDQIYTHISSILISINPYKLLPIYTHEQMVQVRDRERLRRTLALEKVGSSEGKDEGFNFDQPHPFKLAADAHKLMVNRGEHQSVIISGESGSGKTEATKIILKYLSFLSGEGEKSDGAGIEQQLLEANPIIESFGNAQTVRNNNSSRFGKWVEVHFDSQLRIIGGSISHYLLEKSRVVQQSPGERNYHIFHQICASRDHKFLSKYKLLTGKEYMYTKTAKSTGIDGVPDPEGFERTMKAFNCLKFSPEDIDCLYLCLVAILNLGNVKIGAKGGNEDVAEVSESDTFLKRSAELLGVTVDALAQALVTTVITYGGREAIRVPFKRDQAMAGRDALVKHLYGKMFDWMIKAINKRLKTMKYVFAIIGILDIFGFEIFDVNRFEQFLINFANEKLQQHFNHFVFELEQEEYKVEGLSLPYVEFKDNKEILSMIEQPPNGILPIMDEELFMPKSSDETLLQKLHAKQKYRRHYRIPRIQKAIFTIRHYAGDVDYSIDGFLQKNQDKLSDDQMTLIKGSKDPFFANLFLEDKEDSDPVEEEKTKPAGKGGMASARSRFESSSSSGRRSVSGPSGPTGGPSKMRTLGSQFKKQLASLMTKLESTNPHFIRCIKPNGEKSMDNFNSQLVLKQLRYAGIEAVIRVRQTGFPVRHQYRDFYQRFKVLCPKIIAMAAPLRQKEDRLEEFKENTVKLLKALKVEESEYGVGKTKIFITHERHLRLEADREAALLKHVISLQKIRRGKLARVILKKMKKVKQRLQDLHDASLKKPLQDLLRENYRVDLAKAIEMATQIELPPALSILLAAKELQNTLSKKDKIRQNLITVLDSKSEDVSFYEKALEEAKKVGQDVETLSEYVRCQECLEELKRELERKAEAARKAAEREAKRKKKLQEKQEKEKAEADARHQKELAKKAAKEAAAKEAAAKEAAAKEATKGKRTDEDDSDDGDVYEDDDNDSVDSLTVSDEEREKEKEKEKRETQRREQQAEREARRRKEEEERERKDREEIDKEEKAEKEKKEKEEKERKLRWLGLAGMEEFKSLSESALVAALLKKVSTLERENTDIRVLYSTMNEELFKKLEDFEQYKKRVKNMEDKYVERIQKLQNRVNIMEQLRLTDAKDSKDGMTRVYLKRIQELEQIHEKNMEDLVQKCDQLLKLEIEHDELGSQLNQVMHQNQQKDAIIKSLRDQIARLEGDHPRSNGVPGGDDGDGPDPSSASPLSRHASSPLHVGVGDGPDGKGYNWGDPISGVARFLGYRKPGGGGGGGPPTLERAGSKMDRDTQERIKTLERMLKEKDDYTKSLERKNNQLSKEVHHLKAERTTSP